METYPGVTVWSKEAINFIENVFYQKKLCYVIPIWCVLHFVCALRWAVCWCWPGPMSTIAQKSLTMRQCSASSATSATRKSPPSFWSLGPVLMCCPKMAWVPCASQPLQDTWDWSCCFASVEPRWEHDMMNSWVTWCIDIYIHSTCSPVICIFTRWIKQTRAVNLGWFTLLSEDI